MERLSRSTCANARLLDKATPRASAWLTARDSQGIHRTATVGDQGRGRRGY
jgi:hypothetical protein